MTDNELIAEFMGGWNKDPHTRKFGINLPQFDNQWMDIDHLAYNTSWDWLMPVVDKINKIGFTIAINYQSLRPSFDTSIFSKELPEMIFNEDDSSIKATYKSVVEFITWYNLNRIP